MGTPAGVAGQVGLAEEVTVGTRVASARFLEFISEGLKQEINRIESKGIRAGRRLLISGRWAAGQYRVAGPVKVEVADKGMGVLFKHMFGTVVTAGTGPYTHTCSPGDLKGKGLSIQIGRPMIGGTVQPFSYAGLKVASWDLTSAIDAYLELDLNLIGMSEATAPTLDVASYPASMQLYTFTQGVLQVGGSSLDVMSFKLSGNNGLTDRRPFIRGSGGTKELEENGIRAYTGELVADFTSLTEYNRYVNATEFAVILTFTAGASTLVITLNARYDGDTPVVDKMDLVQVPLKFKAIASGSTDDTGIKIAYTTPDTTP